MPYGLTDKELANILSVFTGNTGVKKVILFGSRAKGNFKTGSDVDLAIEGTDLTIKDVSAFLETLEESNLPYLFDIVLLHRIEEPALLEHINRAGKVLYQTN